MPTPAFARWPARAVMQLGTLWAGLALGLCFLHALLCFVGLLLDLVRPVNCGFHLLLSVVLTVEQQENQDCCHQEVQDSTDPARGLHQPGTVGSGLCVGLKLFLESLLAPLNLGIFLRLFVCFAHVARSLRLHR